MDQLLDLLKPLLPNSGIMFVIAIVGLFVLKLLLKVVEKRWEDLLGERIGQGQRLEWVTLYLLLPLLVLGLVQSWPVAVLMFLCGVVVLYIERRFPRPVLTRRFIAIQVGIFAAILLGHGIWNNYGQRVKRRSTQVYSLLSPYPYGDIEPGRLLRLSNEYRRALQQAFEGVTTVEVQPLQFDSAALDEYHLTDGKWKPRQEPDGHEVFISNTARWLGGPDPNDPVVSTVWRLELMEDVAAVKVSAPRSAAKLLALQAVFKLLVNLRDRPGWVLTPDQELTIKKNILREYGRILADLGDDAVQRRVEGALGAAEIPDAEMREILEVYPPPEVTQWAARRESTLRTTVMYGRVE